jgi:LysR family glycine cleavage system transcriptional activator
MYDLRRLPNLAALRAFEAAARHQNFSRAAEEIHLTHGAISHQVRALEQELGLELFKRNGKKITVTLEGQRFAEVIRASLSQIGEAVVSLQEMQRQPRLTISTLPSFAARWLAPRLERFIEIYPDLEVSLHSSNHRVDFAKEGVDIAIRFGSGAKQAGLQSEHLMDDVYYPVASPHFNDGHLPEKPSQLLPSQLLRCHDEPWLGWFRLAGLDLPEPSGGLLYQDSSMLARAAHNGRGIALGRHSIVQSEVASGQLLRLFDIALPSPSSYYLVYPASALEKPPVKAFREWVLEEIGNSLI